MTSAAADRAKGNGKGKPRLLEVPPFAPPPEPPKKRFGQATTLIEKIAVIGYAASREVLAEPIEEVWAGVFGHRHHVEMAGPSYSGKSGLAIGIAVAMANPTGEAVKLLGREVKPMEDGELALIVNEENSKQSAVVTIDRWIEMLGLPPEETWDRIVLLPRRGVKARPLKREDVERPPANDGWANVVHALAHGAFGIAVFDTRARIFAGFGDPNGEDAQAAVSNIITQIIEAACCPVIIVSHTKKGVDGNDIEDISGSAQRGNGADVVLMVTATRKDGRVTSSRLVFLKVRDGIDDHPKPVRFTVAKAGEKWKLTVDADEKGGDGPAHERVYKVLDDAEAEMSANDIRKALGFSHATVKESIDTLRKAKRVKSRPTKKNGAECWVYKSNPSWAEVMGIGRANDV